MYRTHYTETGVRKIKVSNSGEIYYIAEIYEIACTPINISNTILCLGK